MDTDKGEEMNKQKPPPGLDSDKVVLEVGLGEEVMISEDGATNIVGGLDKSTRRRHIYPQGPLDVDLGAVQNLESALSGLGGSEVHVEKSTTAVRDPDRVRTWSASRADQVVARPDRGASWKQG